MKQLRTKAPVIDPLHIAVQEVKHLYVIAKEVSRLDAVRSNNKLNLKTK